MTLSTFLIEQKNAHMEHLEDMIFNDGVDGARSAINSIRSLRDMLAGKSKRSVNVTVKWDGAPAIFAGVDPADGKFFVAKKGDLMQILSYIKRKRILISSSLVIWRVNLKLHLRSLPSWVLLKECTKEISCLLKEMSRVSQSMAKNTIRFNQILLYMLYQLIRLWVNKLKDRILVWSGIQPIKDEL